MGIDPSVLTRMLLASFICGILLELLWECSGIFGFAVGYYRRNNTAPRRWVRWLWVFVRDVVYFFILGVTISVLIYWKNDGQVRFLVFVGIITGFWICYRTLGRLIKQLNERLVKLFAGMLKILLYPLTLVIRFINGIIKISIRHVRAARLRRLTLRKIHRLNIIKSYGTMQADSRFKVDYIRQSNHHHFKNQ